MKSKLTEQFQRIVEMVSPTERIRNPNLRVKELWLRQLLEGMDQVINSKIPKALNAK